MRDTVGWHTARELLEASQYEQVAELLRKAQATSEQKGETILADTLSAAYQICLASSQCRAEAEWHQQACEEADQREHELKQQLCAILDLVNGHKTPKAIEKREEVFNAASIEINPPKRGNQESAGYLSLRQRIRTLLGLGPGPQPPEPELPALPVNRRIEISLASPAVKKDHQITPTLAVYCLGLFRVYQNDKLITDWPSGKGKAIFKYIVVNRNRPIPKDILMDLFWRDAHPEAARNNLNVAIYGLRQAFRTIQPSFSHILFQDDCYLLNPDMAVWVDVEEFVQHFKAGQSFEKRGKLDEVVREYEIAEGLYQGDLFEECLYEDWPVPQREGLKNSYLVILDRLSQYYLTEKRYATCIHLCQKILAHDDWREDAHRRLMRCYSRQGQPYLALRQYHLCVEKLKEELDVTPEPVTTRLYDRIRHHEHI